MNRAALLLALALALLACAAPADLDAAQTANAPRLELTVGKSVVVKTQADIARVSVGDPNVADFVLLTPRQLYVAGKASGVTNITLWDAADQVRGLYDVEVAPDVARLRRLVGDVMPDESGVVVRAAGNSIAVSGTVRSEANLKRLLALAEAHSPGKVLNLLQMGGVQQVMLEVRVAEMSRALAKDLGFNLNAISQGDFLYTFLGGLTSVPLLSNIVKTYTTTNTNNQTVADPYNRVNNPTRFDEQKGPLNITSNVQGMFNYNTKVNGVPTTITGFINILKDNGLVRILAEPTLVCLNGQTAEFLAGGEIPVPIPQALGTISIEWKKYGVELRFTPHVLAGDKISLQVAPSVSELDPANAVQVGSFVIPALKKRSAATVIELGDGQSFAIAGLLSQDTRSTASKFPGVGDVPVLGSLFKSSKFQKNETELLIIITPRLAKPADPKAIKLPTDGGLKEPDDLEFYLGIDRSKLGLGAQPAAPAAGIPAGRTLDGEFGHALPNPPASGAPRPPQPSDAGK
ncbi:Type II secretion system protein D [Fundidesulfovibrio magnetotacticus]|uniref:Type II secretion system protein D n=1 Tax=Fundidesulfovibrio magnetotacticus TaxID=2730080 RepID=A0A6V8LZM7_9BACT|nr:type II and III secretion system protein family protein [Fundidesulfovibrio magnetotacticus]GFK93685.1 Type II secretion system protein D [Fundidesulfovibrio magnetotacticus]